MDDVASRVAKELLRIGAVRLRPSDPFTWASGLRSPIYTDNRLALAYPEVRDLIKAGLAAASKDIAGTKLPGAIVGVATAGIPHAALVADELRLPMAYVRGAAKKHGRQNRIEGRLEEGQRVVVVEDLISTGGSSLDAIAAIREAGAVVVGCVAIFTYGFDLAVQRFEEAAVPLTTLSDYPTLLRVARASETITAAQESMLADWRSTASEQLA